MKKIINIFTLILITSLFSGQIFAEKFIGEGSVGTKNSKVKRTSAAGCLPAKASTELNLNNVRARINTGGDMWWDLQTVSKYEIPKGSTKTSMFSASLWLGGTDVNGQLKGAFQRYRGSGNDYWPGPLTTDGTASVSAEVCDEYDKHFVITREEVDNFILKYNNSDYPDYQVPEIIKEWPANGDVSKGQSQWLAPFVDLNDNGVYEWEQGEYPYYDIENKLCKPVRDADGNYFYEPTADGAGILADQVLKGDQTVWWVFNDNGNIHSETKGNAIGVEIRAQAFAFATNDEINNMTFYTYEIVNRSTYRLTQTYFSQWVDTDLGYAFDDYVGCDVLRGLGYCYNGKAVDGLGKNDHYGEQPPAVGVDFFQGPYMDPDGIDNPKYDSAGVQICDESINGVNFGDTIVDNERFGMRKFVYHNNESSSLPTSDPSLAPEYYQLLKGIWKDQTPMRYGGNAHRNGGGVGPECDFMFPAETDPCNWGTGGTPPSVQNWTEETVGNAPADRRFMQSAGEFTLESGAINYITVGIPWARASSGGPFASVELLRQVDDKAQALFDNCFKVLDGPDAPELIAQEMDKKIIIYLKNLESSNNAKEDYMEEDVTISALNNNDTTNYDPYYRFQGYQVYQLANDEVSVSEVNDPDKARLVFQCDLKDDVENLVNYTFNDKLGGNVPELKVEASNTGIQHSFVMTEDQFASGDKTLVNNKKYYFVALAYSYNNYLEYSQDPGVLGGLYGQKTPYLAGRKSAVGPIKVHTLIPHIPEVRNSGTEINSSYGTGPMITRLDGRGNGGMDLELTQASKKDILANNQAEKIEYLNGRGPLNVKVIDPLNVEAAEYMLKFIPVGGVDTANWVLFKNGDTLAISDVSIDLGNEQLFLEEGISVQIKQNKGAGDVDETYNGFISATIHYEDSTNVWLGGYPDSDNGADLDAQTPSPFNWIRSGTVEDKSQPFHNDYDPAAEGSDELRWVDPNEAFEKMLGGTWAPYRLASKYDNGPAFSKFYTNTIKICQSVDIVYTTDRSKWSRCPVIETGDDPSASEGNANKFKLRASKSIDKDGNFSTGEGDVNNPESPDYISEDGMGWFPGYAINVETGERLNLFYGESSWLIGENGRDMQFNPTSNYATPLGGVLMGGKHFLYVVANSTSNKGCPAYDAGKWLHEKLKDGSIPAMTSLIRDIMWVNIPMARPEKEWLSNDVTIKLRVDFPYQTGVWNQKTGGVESTKFNNDYPAYSFNTNNIATATGVETIAEDALDLIRVVPNPYYAYSDYETNQLDNRVRITNLPEKCTIRIISTNGVIVRTFTKDETNTYFDWDLKNHANIPISSGVYYIHIEAPNIGEKVVKWFCVMRPVDLNAF